MHEVYPVCAGSPAQGAKRNSAVLLACGELEAQRKSEPLTCAEGRGSDRV
jgi:hypothetical protein